MAEVEYLNYEVVQNKNWSIEDDDLFEKAGDADLGEEDYGTLQVGDDQSILIAAEEEGYDWPYGCRQGMCASCTSIVVHGEIDISGQQILTEDEIEDGARVTCIGTPDTEELQIIYNAQETL